jgi:hypothetical protein
MIVEIYFRQQIVLRILWNANGVYCCSYSSLISRLLQIITVGAQKDCIFLNFHSPPPTQNHTKTAAQLAQKSDFFKGII